MKELLKKALPHIIAIALFAAAAIAFFSPVFDGYALKQGDIENYLGMSKELRDYREVYHEEALWTNSMFGGMPGYQISVIHSANLIKHVDRLICLYLPRPVDTVFVSMLGFYILLLCFRVNPWIAIPAAIVFGLGSVNILYLSAGHTAKIKALAYMAPTLGGLYLTYRGKLLSGLALTALFLCLHLSANHLQMTYYLFFLLLFAAIGESVRLLLKKQIMPWLKSSAVLALAGVIGLLPTMSNLLTTYEYAKYSTRGKTELTLKSESQERERPEMGLDKDYILQYSMAKGEFLSILIPDIKGGAAGQIAEDRSLVAGVDKEYREAVGQQNRYWGEQNYSGGAFYFGAAMFVLFLLGMAVLKDREFKWTLFALGVICVMLSWRETNWLGDFFLNDVPMYSQFRDTKMILVLLMIIVPLIGARFLNELFSEGSVKVKPILIGSSALLLLLLLFTAKPDAFFDFISNQEKTFFAEYLDNDKIDPAQQDFIIGIMDRLELVRQDILRADVFRSILLILIISTLVILAALKKLKIQVALPILAIVMVFDVWSVDRRYLDTDNLKKNPRWKESWMAMHPFSPSDADLMILENGKQDFPDLISNYESAIKELNLPEGRQNKDLRNRITQEIYFRELNFTSNYRVLNFGNPFNEANTSFFHKSIGGYHGAKLKRFQELTEIHLEKELSQFAQIAQTSGVEMAFSQSRMLNMLNTRYVIADPTRPPLENPFALGNAWFVDSAVWASDADDEMSQMANFDPENTAIIDERFKSQINEVLPVDSLAAVSLTSYLPNHLEYTCNSSTGGLIVFSEVYYPEGWNAYIDSEPADYIRLNYLLRGMKVNKGEHKIEFKFEPQSFKTGSTVSMAGSVLLLLLCLGSFVLWLKPAKD